mmetsp:Transcript_30694/g.70899  ORF Transcript_30694/g.70899 Transcript_30694/m.70899 type:complete len:264 (-) Transcript_30694:1176-1967(-)
MSFRQAEQLLGACQDLRAQNPWGRILGLPRHAEVSEERNHLVVDQVNALRRCELFQLFRLNASLVHHLRLIGQRRHALRAGHRVGIGEVSWPGLQVLQAMLVSSHDVEWLRSNGDRLTDEKVSELEVFSRVRVLDTAFVCKLATHMSAVPHRNLKDGHIIISRIVCNDQCAKLVFRLAIHHLALEAQDLTTVDHQPLQVNLGRLGLNHLAIDQGVLLPANSSMGRWQELGVCYGLFRHVNGALRLVDTQVLLVELFGGFVTIV